MFLLHTIDEDQNDAIKDADELMIKIALENRFRKVSWNRLKEI